MIASEFIGQTCIGVCRDKTGSLDGEFFNEFTHFFRSESAVESDRKQILRMRHGNKKCLGILSGKQSAAGIADRSRKHHRYFHSEFSKKFLCGVSCGFGIQGIKNRLNQKHINSALNQTFYPGFVGSCHLFKRQITIRRVIDIRRHGKCFAGRPYRTCNKAGNSRFSAEFPCCFCGDLRPCKSDIINIIFQAVFTLGNNIGTESIGFNNICACVKILSMSIFDDIGAADIQNIVVAFEQNGMIDEFFTFEIFFFGFE